ncbi:helix-turn-helix domain-containing protein [Salibacteraceae bacterium]|nr:helix-turn-helix domain-containing protein [Salibacteraceae bacterium]
MNTELTFDQLPVAIAYLTQKMDMIEQLLSKKNETNPKTKDEDELFGVKEAAEFLNLTVPTIYSKVSRGELPVMKRSKKLYFSKIELMNYLKKGRKKTNQEIQEEANNYLNQ